MAYNSKNIKLETVITTDHSSKPAAPVAGNASFYMKDNQLTSQNSAGTETIYGAASVPGVKAAGDAAYTVLDGDGFGTIQVAPTSTRIVTLPTLADNQARTLTIVNTTGSANVTVDGEGAETINGATTITLGAKDDSITLIATSGDWQIISVQKPNGTLKLDTGGASNNGHGTTNTRIRIFQNSPTDTGDAFTYATTAAAGMSVTVNHDMVAAISYTDDGSGETIMGISINSANLTTSIQTLAVSERLMLTRTEGGDAANVAVTVKLSSGDIIRAHTNAQTGAVAGGAVQFVMQEVARL